jgi:hypothetical protein
MWPELREKVRFPNDKINGKVPRFTRTSGRRGTITKKLKNNKYQVQFNSGYEIRNLNEMYVIGRKTHKRRS